MSLASRLLSFLYKLPPAETRDIAEDLHVPVKMPDGAILLANRYYPRHKDKPPTILIRSPYGRASMWKHMLCLPFAERGFQVLLQSCRGTFGSGGAFDPFHNERADGLATVEWLKEQPWFSGEFATFGISYLGFVQWAIAADAGPALRAIAPLLSPSEFRSTVHGGGSFSLETALTWMYLVEHQEKSFFTVVSEQIRARAHVLRAARKMPLHTLDEDLIGHPAPFYRDWLAHDAPGDAWWAPIDFSKDVSRINAPAHLIGGFYDLFLPRVLADYELLRRAGKKPYLTVGPWTHTDVAASGVMLRESIAWFRAHLLGDRRGLRDKPVRIHVMGAAEWRDYDEWPPPGATLQRWYLQPGGGLSTAPPAASEPDRYRYDPNDPTPSVGGTPLGEGAGPRDNRALEARKDVLVYTSAPLDRPVEVIGPVTAELFVTSSLEHTDFFVRLCDVDEKGRSINVCDGIVRLAPGRPAAVDGGPRKIAVELWATAHRFLRGHRVRVQVSSGAHPRFARNPGTAQPLGDATQLVAADQAAYHDPARPSAILLPVMG